MKSNTPTGKTENKIKMKTSRDDPEFDGLRKNLYRALQITNALERQQALIRFAEMLAESGRADLLLQFSLLITEPRDFKIFLGTTFSVVIELDPGEALTWIDELSGFLNTSSPPLSLADALSPVFVELSLEDMDLAYSLISEFEDDKLRDSLLTKNTQSLVKSDISQAADWVERFPNGEHRNKSLFKVGFQWAQKDVASAAKWIVDLPEDEGKDKAIEGLVNIWTSQDPHAAANWAIQLAAPVTREIAVSSVIDSWTFRDPQLVSQWITTFPEGELKRNSFVKTIEMWTQFEPASAEKWLQSMDNPELQRLGLEILGN